MNLVILTIEDQKSDFSKNNSFIKSINRACPYTDGYLNSDRFSRIENILKA